MHVGILPVKPLDVIAMPPLRLVWLPAETLHQPLGKTPIEGVAQQGICLLESRKGIEGLQCPATTGIGGSASGD